MVDDWVTAPNGGEPPIYFERTRFLQRVGEFSALLSAGRFATGLVVCGTRGVGKTLELRRLESRLLESGVLPVRAVLGGAYPLNQALDDALGRAIGNRRATRQDAGTSKFTAKFQFAPVEVAYERERTAMPEKPGARLLKVVEDVIGPQLGGIALLVDEADALEEHEFSDQLSEILEYASSENAPVGIVAAGVSRDIWRRTAQGRRSYMEGLFDPVWLPRLDETQTRELLITTAAEFGAHWESLDLGNLVRATHGVPRDIHATGRDLLRRLQDGVDPEHAPDEVAALHRDLKRQILNIGSKLPQAELRAIAAMAHHGSGAMTVESIVLASIDEASSGDPAGIGAEAHDGLDSLSNRGMIEIDFWGTVTPLFDVNHRPPSHRGAR